jgi:hypothetical protein
MLQTPCSSFSIGARLAPLRESKTSFAFGARNRKVTRLSECTSGDFSGLGAGGVCAKAVAVKRREIVVRISTVII